MALWSMDLQATAKPVYIDLSRESGNGLYAGAAVWPGSCTLVCHSKHCLELRLPAHMALFTMCESKTIVVAATTGCIFGQLCASVSCLCILLSLHFVILMIDSFATCFPCVIVL